MPLGVSEGLIEKAYGPIDYTGFYKGLDAAAKRMAAEEKASTDAAKKEYALNLATFNKSNAGVRAIDAPDVSQLWSEYSGIRKKQISNPNLFKTNPAKWGELESAASQKQAELNTLIQGSKELNKLSPEFKKRALGQETRNQYDVDAEKNWITNVDNKKYKDVISNDFQNESKYFRKDIDATDFYKNLQTGIGGVDKDISQVTLKETQYGVPITKTTTYKIPKIGQIRNIVETKWDATYKAPKQNEMAVEQEFGKMVQSGEADKLTKEWLSKSDDEFKKKYGADKPKIGIVQNGQFILGASKKENLVNLLTIKNYLAGLPETGETKEVVPVGYKQSKAEEKEAKTGETKEEKLFDARPIGKKISEDPTQLYSEGVKLKDFVNKNMGVVGNLILLTKTPLTKKEDIEAFGESKNILKKLGLNENSTAQQYAAAMEAENKKAGFPDLKVPPKGLASGKIFTMTWQEKDASGNLQPRMLTIDLQNQLSLDKLTQLVRSKTAAKKGVSGEALKINTGGGGGYFDNI